MFLSIGREKSLTLSMTNLEIIRMLLFHCPEKPNQFL
jgi:hypothetical protein